MWQTGTRVLGIALVLVTLLANCRFHEASNFHVNSWHGRMLDGTPIQFSDVKAPGLVLNFYSPTCAPCIQELPALELLNDQAKSKGIPFYMVLEGNPMSHGIKLPMSSAAEDMFDVIRNRMLEDIQKFNIKVPVVILSEEFKILAPGSLVTGTPETLFFSTNPLRLKYNFIGPISTSKNPAEIQSETRYTFALQRLGIEPRRGESERPRMMNQPRAESM